MKNRHDVEARLDAVRDMKYVHSANQKVVDARIRELEWVLDDRK